jgi:hypothetical protein
VPSVPSAPTAVVGTIENGKSSVSFTPGADGGSAITGYTVTAFDTTTLANGGQVAPGAGSPITVTGLTNGDGYTFTVTATNAVGTSAASSASSVVVPSGSASSPAPDPLPDALTFDVEKVVNLVQLGDEIAAATGQTVDLALNGYDFTAPISSGNPAVLWVVPDTVSSPAVQTVIDNHTANPNYGTSASTTAFNAVLQAVVTNPATVLNSQQIQDGLKGLLIRYSELGVVGQLNP